MLHSYFNVQGFQLLIVCGFGGIYLHFGTDFGRTARGGVDLGDVLADVHDVHVLI